MAVVAKTDTDFARCQWFLKDYDVLRVFLLGLFLLSVVYGGLHPVYGLVWVKRLGSCQASFGLPLQPGEVSLFIAFRIDVFDFVLFSVLYPISCSL